MIVYAHRSRDIRPVEALSDLRAQLRSLRSSDAVPHDQVVEILIELGEIESGVLDILSPERDDYLHIAAPFSRAMLLAGAALYASWRCRAGAAVECLRRLDAAIGALLRRWADDLPASARVSISEGYAYYGLFPETYIAAAEQCHTGAPRGAAVCLGLRGIGTSLSAVVAASLGDCGQDVLRLTLRPRGHPFDREVRMTEALERLLRGRTDSNFLVIDEGPGLSGSSMACVARMLAGLGVTDDRIVFLPSWDCDGSTLRSEDARGRWHRHRRYVGSFDEVWVRSGRLAEPWGGGELRDLSAGAWRSVGFDRESEFPAVQPQHERRKFLLRTGSGATLLLKFAGLGRYGRDALQRAMRVAAAGFSPRVFGMANGFIASEFVEARPLGPGDVDEALLDRMADYIAWVAKTFPGDSEAPVDELWEMMRANVAAILGDEWSTRLRVLESHRPIVAGRHTTAIDGRMLPHEWLCTSSGYLKTDGVDHHHDHFFPGAQDSAWDVAGTCIEFRLDDEAADTFVDRCARALTDEALPARLPFYRIAYLSYWSAYTRLAAETIAGQPDGARMQARAQRLARQLRSEIEKLDGASPRLIIFDADGTLRRTVAAGKPCPHRADEWEPMPGVQRVLEQVRATDPATMFAIASNQDHVAYGHLSERTARELLADALREATGEQPAGSAVALCPHPMDSACECRKPAPGMLLALMQHHRVAPEQTLFVGDSDVDAEAARRAGVRFAWAWDFFGWGNV